MSKLNPEVVECYFMSVRMPLKYLLSSFLLIVSGFADREQFCAGLKGTLIRGGSIHTGVR